MSQTCKRLKPQLIQDGTFHHVRMQLKFRACIHLRVIITWNISNSARGQLQASSSSSSSSSAAAIESDHENDEDMLVENEKEDEYFIEPESPKYAAQLSASSYSRVYDSCSDSEEDFVE